MATEILVSIGSGNGLVPSGTNPLPEPMLTPIKAVLWHPPYSNSTIDVHEVNLQHVQGHYTIKIATTSLKRKYVNSYDVLYMNPLDIISIIRLDFNIVNIGIGLETRG